MMESCRGTVPSPLHRSGYTTWFVDSAESVALTTSEDLSSTNQQCSPMRSITLLPLPVSEPSGEPTNTTFSHQQPTATRQTHHRTLRHSQRSQSKKHHATTPTSNTFSQKHRSCHKGGSNVGTNHNGEGDNGEEARKESVRPPDCRSQEYLEVESFYLPRSSPVISRRHRRRRRRSLSWHGRERDGPSASSAHSVLVASTAAASPGSSQHETVLNVEKPAAAPSPHHASCLSQEDRKSRGISLSSNLSWFLSAGLHLPFRGQQGLAEDCRGRGLSGSDVPPRPVTQQPNSTDRGSSHIPECTADIFKTSCDVEKENAHFVVVDMVLEVLEGVKWTLSLDQLTSTNTDTHTRCRTGTHTHRRSPKGKRRPEADTHTCKHIQCCSGSDSKHTHDHEDGSENNFIHTDVPRSHRDTYRSAAEIKTHEEEEKPGGVSSEHHAKSVSVLSTDSGFEDCGVEDTLIQRAFLTKSLRCPIMHGDVERLAQQLVLVFRRSWLPSQKPRCGRHSLRSSLQELPGTAGVVVSSGSLTEEIRLRTRMRGTLSWAPPRFQIIFTVQPTHRRSEAVALQHFLCAGCGTELEPRYIKKLRYCEYLGKYFCDCCHSGSESVIPGRILAHWDFSRYPVSDFSRRLLDSVWHQPLFDLTSVGKTLYSRVRELEKFRELQEQLLGVKKLLTACRLSDRVMKEFEQLPAHLTQQPHLFSLDDFLRLKKGQLVPLARAVLLVATEHVDGCELCLARGFICEFCRERDILFPFQRDRCKRCPVCKACFHKTCFVSRNCPKCARIRSRRRALDGAES